MERREGFFERVRRTRAEQAALRNAEYRETIERLTAERTQRHQQQLAAIQEQGERRLAELKKEGQKETLLHLIKSTMEISQLDSGRIRDEKASRVWQEILMTGLGGMWRDTLTSWYQPGSSHAIVGIELNGREYTILDTQAAPENQIHLTPAQLREMYFTAGGKRKDARELFQNNSSSRVR